MRSDADRVGDILEAIAKARERTTNSVDAFRGDEMLQVWVIHHLQVIGEATGCTTKKWVIRRLGNGFPSSLRTCG